MKWIKQEESFRIPVKSWCEEVEPGAMAQAANLAAHPALVRHVALMPDCHQGYGMPIGGVVAAKDAIIPSAVGVDIGCGMVAVETGVPAERLASMEFRRAIQEKLKTRIPVGEGVSHPVAQEWEGFESYLDHNGQVSDFANTLDRKNLGTLGGGNHFIEIQKSDAGFVWLMIHSGSRNLGKRIEEFYHRRARKLNERYRVKLPDPDLAFLPIEEAEGHGYFRDMLFALVNVARREGIDAEEALAASNRKFRARWLRMEELARAEGVQLEGLGTPALNDLWSRAKAEENPAR